MIPQELYYLQQILHLKQFVYLKANDKRDTNKQKVKKVIRSYLKLVGRPINDLELNFYYELFKKGIVTSDELIQLDTTVNGKQSTLKLDDVISLTESDNNISESDIKLESEISANIGLSIEGIPSFGGPPEINSVSSTDLFSKFVVHAGYAFKISSFPDCPTILVKAIKIIINKLAFIFDIVPY